MAKKNSALQAAHDKVMRGNRKEKGGGTRKYGRNLAKCQRYRARIGKPRGRGVPGAKAGRNAGV